MQRTASSRRRPLVSLLVSLAGALLYASTATAVPLASNVIGVYAFGGAVVNDFLTGVATTGGINVRGELLLANDGNLYVATSAGGAGSVGAIERITPSGTAVVMHSLVGGTTEGIAPYAGLIQASDGNLYGTTYLGGTGSAGTVYRIGLDGTFATLFNFTSQSNGPYYPYTSLVQGPDGALYGTTLKGGTSNMGTVFRLTLAGTMTVMHNFSGPDGDSPEGALIFGVDGALYGTTLIGGANDRGVIYKITTGGTYTQLYTFPALSTTFNSVGLATNLPGANPRAGLTLGQDGNFYGTAYQGGAQGYGTIYSMTPAGVVTVLHTFIGAPTDGAYPLAPVRQDIDGSFYGTTQVGGYNESGVVWRISPTGVYSLLHSFTTSALDGGTSYTTMLPLNGYLYGVSFTDLLTAAGTIYKLDLGTNGVLPITLALSAETITLGQSTTLTWTSPTATSCTASGAWTETVGTAGSSVQTPTAAGLYNFVLSCTDGSGVLRNAYASLKVMAPSNQAVDGGATGGGGSLSLLALGMLGGAAGAAARRRYKMTAV